MKYLPVIGLEIHVELKTQSGMFCHCKINQWQAKPNEHVCPICLGLPGALPVPNKKAIEWIIKIGKALNCHINKNSKFDRKHYSYPDLPKGYQISQYDEPIAVNGFILIKTKSGDKKFRIHRVHLEEDTGKLIHVGEDTLVDFNRSGTPLVEIVTEADFDSSEDVKVFLEELHTIIRYLDVSDADMDKGSMRMEPNISLRVQSLKSKVESLKKEEIELPNYKVEVKNINSFRFVKQAIDYEIVRQQELLDRGETPKQETRGFDEKKVETYSQRSKEEAHDYRYFPEPDIPPLEFSDSYIASIVVPELPTQKMKKFIEIGIKEQDAFILSREIEIAVYFEDIIKKISAILNKDQLLNSPQFVANLLINKKLSISLSKDEFVKKAHDLMIPKETDSLLLESVIGRILNTNKGVVEQYKSGKTNAVMFLVGLVMKEMKGKADAKVVIEELKKRISVTN